MSTLAYKFSEPMATNVLFDKERLYIYLQDGREIGVPLEFFPKLREATLAQRNQWRLIGPGIGIHWDTIDEDISVAAVLYGQT